MSELRQDPVSGRWVIIAPERAERPLPPKEPPSPPPEGRCPFCPGNEAETPPEILAVRPDGSRPDSPGWRVRVIPNRYPALVPSGAAGVVRRGLFRRRGGIGVHELVIESPDHRISLTDIDGDDAARAIGVMRDRIAVHRRARDLQYALLFKNVGTEAGASIEHTHTQIIGTPVLPMVVERESQVLRRRWREQRRCVFCQMVHLEAAEGRRMVLASELFVALCPYASRFPLEVWVMPTSHTPDFDTLPDAHVGPLAAFLRDVLGRLEREVDPPLYNLLLHTAPFRGQGRDSFHWHIEVMPRLVAAAGFEWGSGLHVNPVPPEEAAARLR